jgi:hypothetical protein
MRISPMVLQLFLIDIRAHRRSLVVMAAGARA